MRLTIVTSRDGSFHTYATLTDAVYRHRYTLRAMLHHAPSWYPDFGFVSADSLEFHDELGLTYSREHIRAVYDNLPAELGFHPPWYRCDAARDFREGPVRFTGKRHHRRRRWNTFGEVRANSCLDSVDEDGLECGIRARPRRCRGHLPDENDDEGYRKGAGRGWKLKRTHQYRAERQVLMPSE